MSGAGNDLKASADIGSVGIFAGILVNPKEHVTSGASTGSLDPTLALLNNESASLMREGTVAISLTGTNAVNIGDQIMYDVRTGELSARAPTDTAPPANFALVPNGKVVRCNLPASSGRVAIIHLDG